MGRRNLVDVDLDGLAKLVAHRKPRLALEGYQNARDTKGVTKIAITLEKLNPDSRDRLHRLRFLDDNPGGFSDLSHAYTMFVESEKKDDPDASGMFNMGEKLLLAVSKMAVIQTTTGTVTFDSSGRQRSNSKRLSGSDVEFHLVLTRAEVDEMGTLFRTIIPTKPGVVVAFNGEEIPFRNPLVTFEMTLTTPLAQTVADEVRYVQRKTHVDIYEPFPGETPMLYEHGIPVVPSNSKWHYNIGQKVPVPFDRDNVPPAYLAKLHVECVNQMHASLTTDDVNREFVRTALESDRIDPAAFHDIRVKKYGVKTVIHDPNYPEATKRAIAEGHVALYGRSESVGFFENNRKFGDIPTAQVVTPQAVPFSDDPNAPALKMLDLAKITAGMKRVERFAQFLFRAVLGGERLDVRFANDRDWPYQATYGKTPSGGKLTFNVAKLGYAWFDKPPAEEREILDLLIHEFGHHYNPHPELDDHLSSGYYQALTKIGARIVVLAVTEPDLFRPYRG